MRDGKFVRFKYVAAAVIVSQIMAACGALPLPGLLDGETPENTAEVSTESPDENDIEPTLKPTQAPDMALWPLAADLFFLTEQGQVWHQPAEGNASRAERITADQTVIIDFAIAPGDGWIAFRNQRGDVFVEEIGESGESSLIAQQTGQPSDIASGATMAWSQDATRLAYVTDRGFQAFYPGAGLNNNPLFFDTPEASIVDLSWSLDAEWLLILRADNTAAIYQAAPVLTLFAELGRVSGYTWLSDGRLAFAPVEGGLALLAPENLDTRRFIVPQGRFVSLPFQRPDGALLFFIHEASLEEPGFLHIGDASDLSFSPESAVGVDTRDKQWEPSGERLISQDRRSLLLLNPETGSQTGFDPSSAPIDFEWGTLAPEGVNGLRLPADLYFLAPQGGAVQVWRLPSSGEDAELLTRSEEDIMDFGISPDGSQLVYTANGIIYRVILDVTQDTELIVLNESFAEEGATPAFLRGGRLLAYADDGIWLADLTESPPTRRLLVASRRSTQFGAQRLVEVYSNPQWSPDGQWLLVQVEFFEGSSIALVPVTERGFGSIPIQLDLFGSRGRWLQDGRILAFSEGGPTGNPRLTLVTPPEQQEGNASNTSAEDTPQLRIVDLLDIPTADAVIAEDGRLRFVRNPVQFTVGPNSVSVYSADISGDNVQEESASFILDEPRLSPDGAFVAGLVNASSDEESGIMRGRLAVVEVESGEVFVIDGVEDVQSVQWSQ